MTNPKPGITISIPSLGDFQINAICSDYTGTLSCGGKLVEGAEKRLRELRALVDIHVVTSDTTKTAPTELARIPLTPHIIENDTPDHHIQKRAYLAQNRLDPKHVAVFGNGKSPQLYSNSIEHFPYTAWRRWHIDVAHSNTTVESVDDSVDDRWRRADGAGLTRALDAQWVCCRGHVMG